MKTPKVDSLALKGNHEQVAFGPHVTLGVNTRMGHDPSEKWVVRVFGKCVECPILGNSFSTVQYAKQQAKRIADALEVLKDYPEIAQVIGKHGH